ncbi:MAG: hypothetical protein JJE30_08610 [Desulfuromonadales bacterium]|nr:hypothetical protein [Desulfuromonadales bacterium]
MRRIEKRGGNHVVVWWPGSSFNENHTVFCKRKKSFFSNNRDFSIEETVPSGFLATGKPHEKD